MDQSKHIQILDQWAKWGKIGASRRLLEPDWSAVDFLINAARPRFREDSVILRELLERSRGQLKFPDPLLCDLGIHRWLDREESYSDWLAWVLDKLGDADAVLRVLGVQNQEFQSMCSGKKYRVEREAFVEEGAPGCEGWIDLLLHFGEPEQALLGVEVKTGDKGYEKQLGYFCSLGKRCPHLECVLIDIPEVSSANRFGFEMRRWQDLGIALRQEIARYVKNYDRDSTAAMMCGFIAAIEQNLLGFGTTAARRAWNSQPTLLSKPLKDYLRGAVGEVSG